jgi:hypothetical protein
MNEFTEQLWPVAKMLWCKLVSTACTWHVVCRAVREVMLQTRQSQDGVLPSTAI